MKIFSGPGADHYYTMSVGVIPIVVKRTCPVCKPRASLFLKLSPHYFLS